MNNTNCLNCGKELTDKFCSGCGQKSDIHRITFKNFFLHDVLHGTFHIEKGMLFTAKEAIVRPGKAALDYIAGKRKRYYNVFLLILVTAGLMLFFRHFYIEIVKEQGRTLVENPPNLNEASKKIDAILSQKSKLVIFLFVPFAAMNSFLLFKRRKLNLLEHSVIAGMLLLGILIFSTVGNLLFFFDLLIKFNDFIANSISLLTIFTILFYVGYGYYNAFGDYYTKTGILYRVILFYALLFIEVWLLLLLLIGVVTNWEMSDVTVTPFG